MRRSADNTLCQHPSAPTPGFQHPIVSVLMLVPRPPALPGRKQSALSPSFLQQAAAEGAAVAAGTPPGRMLNLHGMELSSSLRYLRRRVREYLGEGAANDVAVTMYDVGGGDFYPLSSEQFTSSSGCACASERWPGPGARVVACRPWHVGCGEMRHPFHLAGVMAHGRSFLVKLVWPTTDLWSVECIKSRVSRSRPRSVFGPTRCRSCCVHRCVPWW